MYLLQAANLVPINQSTAFSLLPANERGTLR
jgi:hypothetical protein